MRKRLKGFVLAGIWMLFEEFTSDIVNSIPTLGIRVSVLLTSRSMSHVKFWQKHEKKVSWVFFFHGIFNLLKESQPK